MVKCEGCEVEDGSMDYGDKTVAEVLKRACGEFLCQECYREHLVEDRSVGIFGCATCESEIYQDEMDQRYHAWKER